MAGFGIGDHNPVRRAGVGSGHMRPEKTGDVAQKTVCPIATDCETPPSSSVEVPRFVFAAPKI
jgi:hypothetical protein